MSNGWHFKRGDEHYWVCADDVSSAREIVARFNKAASLVDPGQIPHSVVQFFGLKPGGLVTGMEFKDGKPIDA